MKPVDKVLTLEMVSEYRAGKISIPELAQQLGVSRTWVLDRFHRQGVKTHNRHAALLIARVRGRAWRGIRFKYEVG